VTSISGCRNLLDGREHPVGRLATDLADDRGRRGEVHIERPDVPRVVVIVNIAPLKDAQGQAAGAINYFYT
jgi:hypothetical protein